MRRPLVVMLSAAAILCLTVGMCRSYGLFLKPITTDLGIGRNAFAFAVAIQQVMWGVGQPFAGMIADRFGAARVLVVGALFYLAGLVMMGSATSGASLIVSTGLLVGLGISASTFSVVLGAVGRLVSEEKRAFALAVASTGGSFGQFMIFPVTTGLLAATSWSRTLTILGCSMAVILPLSLALRGKVEAVSAGSPAGAGSMFKAVGEALGHRGYLYLVAGFSVCGFHVAFISTHLPAHLTDHGLDVSMGNTAMIVIGFFNVIGTYVWGLWGGRYRKKYLLAGLYFVRGLALVAFLALPVSSTSALVFAAVMGLLWLGTVPLTSGLIAQMFGTRYMSTLFGGVFLGHQIGAFLGVWLGGYVYDRLHSYGLTWQLAIALSFMATFLHLRLLDEPEPPREPALAVAAE